MKLPVCIDPAETWEIDLMLDASRYAVELWQSVLEQAKARAAEAASIPDVAIRAKVERDAKASVGMTESSLAFAEKERDSYVPGTGPIFIIGHVPAPKRAEIAGMMEEAQESVRQRERFATEHEWRREIVRFAVRGHRNLLRADGQPAPFEGETRKLGGQEIIGPTEGQIERYSTFLADLASACMRAQRLSETIKNR